MGEGLDVWTQFRIQLVSTIAVVGYTAIVSFAIFKMLDAVVGIRVSSDEEIEGLDAVEHGVQSHWIE